jgi:hypothetical protein
LRRDDIVEFDDPEEGLNYWRKGFIKPVVQEEEGG